MLTHSTTPTCRLMEGHYVCVHDYVGGTLCVCVHDYVVNTYLSITPCLSEQGLETLDSWSIVC